MIEEEVFEYCFTKGEEGRLIPLHLTGLNWSCDEFEPKAYDNLKFCIFCNRFGYIKSINGVLCRMHGIKGEPTCGSVFGEHNEEFWPSVREENKIYTRSGKTWCKKTTKEESDIFFDYMNKVIKTVKDRKITTSKDDEEIYNVIKSRNERMKGNVVS